MNGFFSIHDSATGHAHIAQLEVAPYTATTPPRPHIRYLLFKLSKPSATTPNNTPSHTAPTPSSGFSSRVLRIRSGTKRSESKGMAWFIPKRQNGRANQGTNDGVARASRSVSARDSAALGESRFPIPTFLATELMGSARTSHLPSMRQVVAPEMVPRRWTQHLQLDLLLEK